MFQHLAETVKSFALDYQIIFDKLLRCEICSTLTLAPTGAAADNCEGEISDRALLFNSSYKTYQPFISQNPDKCKKLQDKMETLSFHQLEEFYMIGLKLIGHSAQRLNSLGNCGAYVDTPETQPYLGYISFHTHSGYQGQLLTVTYAPKM